MSSVSAFCEHNLRHVLILGSTVSKKIQFITVTETSGKLRFSKPRTLDVGMPVETISWRDEFLLIGSNDRMVHVFKLTELVKTFDGIPEVIFEHVRTDSGSQLHYFPLSDSFTFNDLIHSVEINPRRKEYFASGINNQVHFWHFERNDKPVASLKGSNDPLMCLEWNPATGNEILISGRSRKLKLLDFRVATNSAQSSGVENLIAWQHPNAHSEAIRDVKWNPLNPNWVASCGNDGVICVWDLRFQRDAVVTMIGHANMVRSISWSHSHPEFLLSGGIDKCCKLWSANMVPHYYLADAVEFQDIAVKVAFSQHNLFHSYAVSSSGELSAQKISNDFLKAVYVGEAEEDEEAEIELLIYCREFSRAFPILKKRVRHYIHKKKYSNALKLVDLVQRRNPLQKEKDPKVRFQKEMKEFSKCIPMNFKMDEKMQEDLHKLRFNCEILNTLQHGSQSEMEAIKLRIFEDIALIDTDTLTEIIEVYIKENVESGMLFVEKVLQVKKEDFEEIFKVAVTPTIFLVLDNNEREVEMIAKCCRKEKDAFKQISIQKDVYAMLSQPKNLKSVSKYVEGLGCELWEILSASVVLLYLNSLLGQGEVHKFFLSCEAFIEKVGKTNTTRTVKKLMKNDGVNKLEEVSSELLDYDEDEDDALDFLQRNEDVLCGVLGIALGMKKYPKFLLPQLDDFTKDILNVFENTFQELVDEENEYSTEEIIELGDNILKGFKLRERLREQDGEEDEEQSGNEKESANFKLKKNIKRQLGKIRKKLDWLMKTLEE